MAMFSGIDAKLIQTVSMAAFKFLTYEHLVFVRDTKCFFATYIEQAIQNYLVKVRLKRGQTH